MMAISNHTSLRSFEKGLLSISLNLSLICNAFEWLPLPDTGFPRALNTLESSRLWTKRLTTPRSRANWASSCLNFSINRSTRNARGRGGPRRLVHLAALVRSLHWKKRVSGTEEAEEYLSFLTNGSQAHTTLVPFTSERSERKSLTHYTLWERWAGRKNRDRKKDGCWVFGQK